MNRKTSKPDEEYPIAHRFPFVNLRRSFVLTIQPEQKHFLTKHANAGLVLCQRSGSV